VARPLKYSPEKAQTIVKAINGGNTFTNAARLAGISYETLNQWRKKYPEFSEAVEGASAYAESVYVEDIGFASRKGNVAATIFWLERRRHDEWRKPADRLEVTDTSAQIAAIAKTLNLSPDVVAELAADADLLIEQRAQR